MTTDPHRCTCDEPMEYQAAYVADPSTNTAEWRGGWSCPGCGRMEEIEDPEPFDEMTGPMEAIDRPSNPGPHRPASKE